MHVCELCNGASSFGRVAVKLLRKNASAQASHDFKKEMSVLSRLSHPNVVKVIGVINDDDESENGDSNNQSMVIVEYMEFGDLNEFLKQRSKILR